MALTQRPGLRELGLQITNYCSAKNHKLQGNWKTKTYVSTSQKRTGSAQGLGFRNRPLSASAPFVPSIPKRGQYASHRSTMNCEAFC